MQEYRNIYQIARETSGLTQERAAELFNISVESLRSYETDRRIPQDSTVLKMIEVYGTPFLAMQHLRKSALGEKYIPEVEQKDLAIAVLNFLNECSDLENIKNLMIKISADNKIDESEKEDWNHVLEEVNGIISAGITLRFVK
nr:MAG TPA: helix-turn-helix domain protein [Caudoviricetes sp.]